MKRDCGEVLDVLTAHADEIRELGVLHLALFGSTVRDEAREDSDVDILVDIDTSRPFSLVDLSTLHLFLSDLLGREVEIAQRPRLKPLLKDHILSEAIEVF